MAMTVRLPADIETELRAVAEGERRSMHATVLLAIEAYLGARESDEIRADPETLRSLAEAREAVQQGDVIYGVGAVHDMVAQRKK